MRAISAWLFPVLLSCGGRTGLDVTTRPIPGGNDASTGHADASSARADVAGSSTCRWAGYAPRVTIPVTHDLVVWGAGDFNADGAVDLVAIGTNPNDDTQSLGILFNEGGRTSFRLSELHFAGYNTTPSPGDFNGDGRLDLATINNNAETVGVFLNHGDGTLADQITYPITGCSQRLASADLDGDGALDAVAPDYCFGRFSVLLNRGDGTFAPSVSGATGLADADDVAIADFDGDGHMDLAFVSFTDGEVAILSNNGRGTFARELTRFATQKHPRRLAAPDVNGDGRPDIVVVAVDSSVMEVFVNRGDGTFAAAADYSFGAGNWAADVTAADLDGDGHPDIVFLTWDPTQPFPGSPTRLAMFMNAGDGTFHPEQAFDSGRSADPTVADFNGDGLLDIAVRDFDTDTVSLYFANCR